MFNKNLLKHFKWLKKSFSDCLDDLQLDIDSFRVSLDVNGDKHILYPTFLVRDTEMESISFSREFTDEVVMFKGWKHYPVQTINSISNKLQTKVYLSSKKISVPRASTHPDTPMKGVIVKRERSSFGSHINGPFNSTKEYVIDRRLGEFYEELIPGTILKIWYWNNEPVVVEMEEWPIVKGDGYNTIYDLLALRKKHIKRLDNYKIEEVLNYYGKSLDDVLAEGEEQIVDFRYASVTSELGSIDEFVCPLVDNPELQVELQNLGNEIWDRIKQEASLGFVTTADAVYGMDNKLYVLEINCNPEMHPVLYGNLARHLKAL